MNGYLFWEKEMTLVLRVDDFPGTKPLEFDRHNLDNYKLFDEALERNGVQQYILGFIPKYCTPEMLEWIATNPRIVLALHGVEHDESRKNDLEFKTEDEIVSDFNMIRTTLAYDFGKDVKIYMPPHNVFDVKTVKGAKRAGFEAITGGPETDPLVAAAVMMEGLEYLHSLFPYEYGRSDELIQRGSVEFIEAKLKAGRDSILTLHWTWEFNIGLEHLERYLARLQPYFSR